MLLLASLAAFGPSAQAQEMEARAYSRAPVGSNVVLLIYSYQNGDVLLDPALPLRDVNVSLNSTVLGYGRTFSLAGRQATASAAVPYVWGSVRGTVFEQWRVAADWTVDPGIDHWGVVLYGEQRILHW
jgi:hypothetical protein